MHEKEKLIKEQRVIEATRKDFMGLQGKFGIILKYLGEPIIAQGSDSNYGGFSSSSTPLQDVWELEDEEKIPEWDEDEGTSMIGHFFNGLNRGMHLEIKYIEGNKELSVNYKGHTVYCEIAGELECYAPFDDWENKIEGLYKVAAKKQKNTKIRIAEEKKIEDKNIISAFLDRLRMKWGL